MQYIMGYSTFAIEFPSSGARSDRNHKRNSSIFTNYRKVKRAQPVHAEAHLRMPSRHVSDIPVYTAFIIIVRLIKRPQSAPRPRKQLSVRQKLSVREVPPGPESNAGKFSLRAARGKP